MRSPAAAIAWEFRQRHRAGLIALGGYLLVLGTIKALVLASARPVHLDSPQSFAFGGRQHLGHRVQARIGGGNPVQATGHRLDRRYVAPTHGACGLACRQVDHDFDIQARCARISSGHFAMSAPKRA